MLNLNIFFNHKIESIARKQEEESPTWAEKAGQLGDFLLTPIRIREACHRITIDHRNNKTTITHEELVIKIRKSLGKRYFILNIIMVTIVASTFFTLPLFTGMVFGTVIGAGVLFKGISYALSPSIRENHKLAVLHYTGTKQREIGSENQRLSLEKIKHALKTNNPLNQPTEVLIIYAEKGTELVDYFPELLNGYDPKKLILIGAKIVPQNHDKYIKNNEDIPAGLGAGLVTKGWNGCFHIETNKTTSLFGLYKKYNVEPNPNRAYVDQKSVKSVQEAIKHTSDKPQVYVIE